MTRTAKILMALLMICSLQISASGQRRRSAQGGRGAAARQQTVTLPFPPLRTYVHQSPVESKYDRFNNRTSVSVETGLNAVLNLRASFSYSGNRLLSPADSVVLIFTQISSYRLGISGGDFIRNREVIILSDGRAVRTKGVYQNGGISENGWHEEDLGIELPVRTFLTIINSQSVSAKMADMEVDFSKETFEALSDLASRMNPKANVDAAESTARRRTQSTLETKEQDAEAVSSQLESLAAQSQSAPQSVTPLVGKWIFETNMTDDRKLTLNVTFRSVNGSYKCLNFQTGQVIEFRDCVITGNSFTFKFQSTARDGRAWNFTYTGNVQGNKAAGKVIADDGSARSMTLPLTGTRIE